MKNYKNSKQNERCLHNLFDRRKRWPDLCWKESKSDNLYLNKNGYNIVIYEDDNNPAEHTFRIVSPEGEHYYHSRIFNTIDEAMLAAFDWMAEELKWSAIKKK